ncbi:MAG: GNAT family N-acetyltransferase [Deltaproteobacteria bacterium]|nr:GNAT family N-acetyltransferase [Deltaproteobacteria bacterium]
MNIEIPIIQRAEPSDAALLAKLAEKTFKDAFAQFLNRQDFERYVARSFTENQIRSELIDSANTFFIARLEDKWVGYAKLYQGPAPDCVKLLPAIELARLYAMQEYLGYGIGAALLEACISYARSKAFKSIWLGSWQENHRGNAFYTKMQFDVLGTKTFTIGSDIQEDYIFARSIR